MEEEVKKEVYANGKVVIDVNTLYFNGETLNLNILESSNYQKLPRRSIFAGLTDWFYGFLIMMIVCNIWRNLMFLGDIYCFLLVPLIIYNIVHFFQDNYSITVRTKSGKEYSIVLKDLYMTGKIVKNINQKIEKVNNTKSNITINNGIINKGNNNVNKIKKARK